MKIGIAFGSNLTVELSRRPSLDLTGKVSAGGAGVHPLGSAEGVQKCRFVRGSCGARNLSVAPQSRLPATKITFKPPSVRGLVPF